LPARTHGIVCEFRARRALLRGLVSARPRVLPQSLPAPIILARAAPPPRRGLPALAAARPAIAARSATWPRDRLPEKPAPFAGDPIRSVPTASDQRVGPHARAVDPTNAPCGCRLHSTALRPLRRQVVAPPVQRPGERCRG